MLVASGVRLDAAPGDVKWTMPNSKATAPALVVIGKEGDVFIRTGDGKVHAVDSATSKDKWVFTGGGPCAYLVHSPDGTLFVDSSATNLSALDGATGVEKWRFQSDSAIYTRPALGHNGRLYFGTSDTNLCVVDAAAGQQIAAFPMDDLPREFSTPTIGNDGTVYLCTARSNVCAIDGITGTTRWRCPLGTAPISGPALGVDGTVYAATENFRLYALKGADGAVRWSHAFQKRVFAPVVAADGTLYVVEDLTGLHALDPATGTNKWSCPRNNIGPGTPILAADGTLYAGSSYRWMVAISAASGQMLWERRFDEPCVGDALALGLDGTVYASGWNYLYALEGTAPLASAPWAKAGGDAWNRSAQVVAGAPDLLIQTADQAVPEQGAVMAGVVFSGQGMTYRWFLNDAPLAVELDRSYLALTNFSPAQAGQYRVVASNAFGETASEPIRISLGYTIATHINGPGEIHLAPALSLYPAGSQVEVQAVPTNGVFRGWSGALTGTNNPAVLTVTSNLELTATYEFLPGQLIWEWIPLGSVRSAPVIGPDGTAYLSSASVKMCALNPLNGQVRWEYAAGGQVSEYAALGDNGLLYFGAADKQVHAVDASTGQKQWTYLTGGTVSLAPAIGPDGTVYAASADRNLYALDGSTGEVKWQYQTGDGPGCSPIVGADGTVFLARKTGTAYYVCALDPGTGTERWSSSRFGTLRDALMVGADGTVFCASSGNKTVYALAAVSGQILWQSQLGGSIGVGSMVIGGDGTIFAGCSDKKLYALDPASGQTKWTCPSGGGSGGPGPLALAADGTVYVTTDVELIALEGESHQLKWRYRLPFTTGGVAVTPTGALLLSSGVVVSAIQGTAPLAATPWPKFRADNQNTGRISTGSTTNHAPTLAPIGSQTIQAGSLLTVTNAATDPDLPAQRLTFSLMSGPAGMIIDAVTGVLTWTPDASLANTTATGWVEVTDNGIPNLSVSRSFEVSVLPPAQPELRLMARAQGAGLQLVWDGAAGPQFVLERSPSLSAPIWTPVTEGIAEQDGQRVFSDPGQGQQAYYRLRVGP